MSPSWTVRRPMIWGLVVINILFIGTLLYLAPRTILHSRLPANASTLPVLAAPAAFELTRETGEGFSSASLKGRPWIADFIFTRCPNQCPAMSFRFAALQKTLPSGVRLVSFSTDPEYDSPARLSEYAQRFKADPKKWVFLTGNLGVIHGIQTELHLIKAEERDPGLHSLRFVLMDSEGRARGYYDSEDGGSLEKLNKDLKKLERA